MSLKDTWRSLRSLKAGFTSRDQWEKNTEYTGLFCVLCPIQQSVYITPSLPFPADVPVETSLFTPHISREIQLQVGFDFTNLIPACFFSVSIFLQYHLTLLPPLECFFFTFELPVHPCFTSCRWGLTTLDSERGDPWKSVRPPELLLSSARWCHMGFFQAGPILCFLDVQGC